MGSIPRDDNHRTQYDYDFDEQVFKVAGMVWNATTLQWEKMQQPVIELTTSNLYLALDTVEAKLQTLIDYGADLDETRNDAGSGTDELRVMPVVPLEALLQNIIPTGVDAADLTHTNGRISSVDYESGGSPVGTLALTYSQNLLSRVAYTAAGGGGADALLLETGDGLLLEAGDAILLE